MAREIYHTADYLVSYPCDCDITFEVDGVEISLENAVRLSLTTGFEIPVCPGCGVEPTVTLAD